MTGVEGLKKVDSLTPQRDLISSVLGIRLGCIGCKSEGVGCYEVVVPRKDARTDIGNFLISVGDETGLPVNVRTSCSNRVAGIDTNSNCQSGDRPCQDPETIELALSVIQPGS